MRIRVSSISLITAVAMVPVIANCSGTADDGTDDGVPGGTGNGGSAGTGVTGGASGSVTGGASGSFTGGSAGVGSGGTGGDGVAGGDGGTAMGGMGGDGSGSGGTTSGSAGVPTGGGAGAAGTGGTGGSAGKGGTGGSGGGTPPPPLDCGALGYVVNNAGPPANRVNYVILADGYTTATLETTMVQHLSNYMTRQWSQNAQPYLRYKKFINICALKLVSQANGALDGTPNSGGNTALRCQEHDPGMDSRLAECDETAANAAIRANVPSSFQVDWHSIMLNNSEWWNSGGPWMLFSGGNADGPGAALHEGGHGFHQLADEYGTCTGASCGSGNTNGTGTSGTRYDEVNSCGNPMTTDGKWTMWMGFTQTGATGLHGTWVNSRYVATDQYRPTANSMMNSLFCTSGGGNGMTGCPANTAFNAPSAEKMIMDIWRIVVPIDSTMPPAGAANNPATLTVNVIDPEVISVDWSVDGTVVAANGGPTFTLAGRGIASGSHMISARAYDNASMDLVRYRTGTTFGRMNWARSVQTVNWTVTVP
jgi:hypothetical protein